MPVNKEELVKDLDSPEYQTIAKEALAKKDFIIRNKTEETAFLDRYKTDVIEKEIPSKINEVHSQYDKDIKELYGAERSQGEKTYEYLKRVATARNSEHQKAVDEVKVLKEQIKGGDPTGTIRKQLEEAENKVKTVIAEKDKELNEYKTKVSSTERVSQVRSVYSDLKGTFKKEKPALWDRTEKAILDEAFNQSVIKDGKLFMTNADGSIRKDAQYNEITVDAFLKNEFKDVVDPKYVQGGGGAAPKGGEGNRGVDPKTVTEENFSAPESVKSRDDLVTYMMTIGLVRGSEQFNKIYKKHSEKLPIF